MLDIKFDGISLDPNKVTNLTRKNPFLTDNFKLGSTASTSYTVEVHDSALNPSSCTIYDGTDLIATLSIDNIEKVNDTTTSYTFTDGMVRLNFNYDASNIIDSSSKTDASGNKYVYLSEIIDDMLQLANLQLSSDSVIPFANLRVSTYDNTITARQYLGWIAEISGGYAYINESGEVVIKPFSTTPARTIDLSLLGEFTVGEQRVFDNVKVNMGDDTISASSGVNVLWLDGNNVFITDGYNGNTAITIQDIVDSVYATMNGFTFYNISIKNMPIIETNAGSIVSVGSYPIIWTIDQHYAGKWLGGLELKLGSEEQAATEYVGTETRLKTIKTIVDRNANTFTREIAEVNNTIDGKVQELNTAITQSANAVRTEVSQNISNVQNDLQGQINQQSTAITQTSDNLLIEINRAKAAEKANADAIDEYNTYFKFDNNGVTVGKSDSDIRGVFGNSSLDFIDSSDTKLAWLSTTEGLGATELSVGDATTISKRWRIITSEDGNHLRFTRHS